MSARLILHIVTTLVLFAIGFWLYMRMQENVYDSIDSTSVAVYWFTALVYIFFSWIFYWIVHRLKLKAWLIAQVLAIIVAAVSILALQYISRDHQQKLEDKVLQEDADIPATQSENVQESGNASETGSEDKP